MTQAGPEPPSPPPATGRRSAAKLEVREAIRREALVLFSDQGFEAVTTQQIAERAGVTQRTLFRHYPAKADILLDGVDRVEIFDRALRREMAETPDPREAVRRALRALAVDYDRRADEIREVYAIIAGCRPLHALERQRHARIDELLAQALDGPAVLAQDARPSLAARTAAGAALGFMRPVIRAWMWREIAESMEALAIRAWPEVSAIIDRSLAYAGDLPPDRSPPGRA